MMMSNGNSLYLGSICVHRSTVFMDQFTTMNPCRWYARSAYRTAAPYRLFSVLDSLTMAFLLACFMSVYTQSYTADLVGNYNPLQHSEYLFILHAKETLKYAKDNINIKTKDQNQVKRQATYFHSLMVQQNYKKTDGCYYSQKNPSNTVAHLCNQ